jgi:hypothetical protein
MGNSKAGRNKKSKAEAVAEPVDATKAPDPPTPDPWFLRLQGTVQEIDMAMDDWRQFSLALLRGGVPVADVPGAADAMMHEALMRRAILEAPEAEAQPQVQDNGAAAPAS